jgi:hypothetical protein
MLDHYYFISMFRLIPISPDFQVSSGNFLKKWLGHSYPLGLW